MHLRRYLNLFTPSSSQTKSPSFYRNLFNRPVLKRRFIDIITATSAYIDSKGFRCIWITKPCSSYKDPCHPCTIDVDYSHTLTANVRWEKHSTVNVARYTCQSVKYAFIKLFVMYITERLSGRQFYTVRQPKSLLRDAKSTAHFV